MKHDSNRPNASDQPPRCPRCGYDQTGMIGWESQCPLEGKCSECGLDFLWRDVLHPRFSVPQWCVEYGSLGAIPMRIVRTLMMMLRPWRFWRELQMHHEPGLPRVAIMLLVTVIVLGYASFAIGAGLDTHAAASYSASVGARTTPPWIEGVQAAFAPFWFTTNTAYGPMPSSSIHRFEPASILTSGWHAMRFGFNPMPWQDSRHSIAERGFVVIVSALLCGMAFMLLPASRRIARVQWKHVFRIGLYSMAIVVIPISLDVLSHFRAFPRGWSQPIAYGLSFGCAAVLALWWAMATGRYLRMSHAWAVGAYVVLFGFLAQYFIFQCIDLAIELAS